MKDNRLLTKEVEDNLQGREHALLRYIEVWKFRVSKFGLWHSKFSELENF
jgi:hypothetical protein